MDSPPAGVYTRGQTGHWNTTAIRITIFRLDPNESGWHISRLLMTADGLGRALYEALCRGVMAVAALGETRMTGEGSSSQVNRAVDSSVPSASTPEGRKWPARLKESVEELRCPRDELSRDEARGKAWKILNGSISLYIRFHAARLGRVSREDSEDLAAEKSLDLIRRIESGKTDFSNRSPSEIASFLSKVARNELVDFLRKQGRRGELRGQEGLERGIGDAGRDGVSGTTASPEVLVERREYVEALRRCVGKLNSRSRLAWFFRVFYGMGSKDIAVHPKIGLKVSHVDVLLQRSREAIRECVRRAGFDPREMPPGTFVELWKAFRQEEV